MTDECLSRLSGVHKDTESPCNNNPDLCWKCQALLNIDYPADLVVTETGEIREEPDKKQVRIIKTTDSVEVSAASGCILCLHLLHSLGESARSALSQLRQEDTELDYEEYLSQKEGRPPCISLHITSSKSSLASRGGNEIQSLLQLFPASCISPFVQNGTVTATTESTTTWSCAADWIDQCKKTHKLCNTQLEGKSKLPSRIIDLGPNEYTVPKLCLVNNESLQLLYATLSHCWGSHVPLQLLSTNISAFETEIPVSELSKTFRDAVTVTRRMGLRYLWVDSLCIIQDSISDWQAQSATMGQVYSNSYCNIAAAHAVDGRQGLFGERNPDLVKPVKIHLNWGPSQGVYYAVRWLYWRANILATPLLGRAWVCQERYLSPRTLYFGATQLFWECCDVFASESFPRGVPLEIHDLNLKGLDPEIDGACLRRGAGFQQDPDLNVFNLWDQVVRTYSIGKLTHSTDRLVALSGLAARLQQYTRCEYLAGLWRHHLAYQLLWEVRGIQWMVSARPRDVYIAPTWSWASVEGYTETACLVERADDLQIMLKILEARTELVDEKSRFGQVKNGFLRLRCKLAKAGVQTMEASNESRLPPTLLIDGRSAGEVILDCPAPGQGKIMHDALYYLPVQARFDNEDWIIGDDYTTAAISGLVLHTLEQEATRS